ncbi:hypothetical protein ACRALDRAFT_207981 [Sodiomyces alcalophilus JCM 7366]|uniref:uncharacterized protein n=1 Tax=Sodiomyces alcalophilus JCM 7366 TaxID=591952 RepID=UPI0039B50D10
MVMAMRLTVFPRNTAEYRPYVHSLLSPHTTSTLAVGDTNLASSAPIHFTCKRSLLVGSLAPARRFGVVRVLDAPPLADPETLQVLEATTELPDSPVFSGLCPVHESHTSRYNPRIRLFIRPLLCIHAPSSTLILTRMVSFILVARSLYKIFDLPRHFLSSSSPGRASRRRFFQSLIR